MLLHDEDSARAFVAARCSAEAFIALEVLVGRLREANRHQNLVSATSLETVWLRHIADSAQILDHVSRETDPWVDLGSGAGFPGLVVAIMRPHVDVFLVESRRLRSEWLQANIDHQNLKRCRVLAKDIRRVETFEAAVITARAFAPLPDLVKLAARFSTNQTRWILPKGRTAEQDISMLPNHLHGMFHVKQSVTDVDAGIVVGEGQIAL